LHFIKTSKYCTSYHKIKISHLTKQQSIALHIKRSKYRTSLFKTAKYRSSYQKIKISHLIVQDSKVSLFISKDQNIAPHCSRQQSIALDIKRSKYRTSLFQTVIVAGSSTNSKEGRTPAEIHAHGKVTNRDVQHTHTHIHTQAQAQTAQRAHLKLVAASVRTASIQSAFAECTKHVCAVSVKKEVKRTADKDRSSKRLSVVRPEFHRTKA